MKNFIKDVNYIYKFLNINLIELDYYNILTNRVFKFKKRIAAVGKITPTKRIQAIFEIKNKIRNSLKYY
jgi:hypothetical protein